jgi:hypothetical protein
LVHSEPQSVPDSVEARIVSKGMPLHIEIRLKDWALIQGVGLGTRPDLTVAFAWSRCSGPSIGGGHKMLPKIQLVSREKLDIPKTFWPTSWEDLVKHIEGSGHFRTVVAICGGMDPSTAQQQLVRVEFSPNLDWDEKDHCRARARAEAVIQAAELDHLAMMTDQLIPPEFGKLLRHL